MLTYGSDGGGHVGGFCNTGNSSLQSPAKDKPRTQKNNPLPNKMQAKKKKFKSPNSAKNPKFTPYINQ